MATKFSRYNKKIRHLQLHGCLKVSFQGTKLEQLNDFVPASLLQSCISRALQYCWQGVTIRDRQTRPRITYSGGRSFHNLSSAYIVTDNEMPIVIFQSTIQARSSTNQTDSHKYRITGCGKIPVLSPKVFRHFLSNRSEFWSEIMHVYNLFIIT